MGNSLTNFHETAGIVSFRDLNAALDKGVAHKPQAQDFAAYLKIDRNSGAWMYGAEGIEVEDGSLWALNTYSLCSGWVAWADPKKNNKKREKLGEVMGSFSNPPAEPDVDHSEKGGEWTEQIGFDLVCISGEDKGEGVTYRASSLGALKAYDALYTATLERPSEAHCFPIVTLQENHYDNKTYGGITYEPVFEIVDWADTDQNLLNKGSDEPQKTKTSEAADVGSDTAPEADAKQAPKRRRRQAAA